MPLGMVPAGEKVVIEFNFLQKLEIRNGSFHLKVSPTVMPLESDWTAWDYLIDYEFTFAINSPSIITHVSHPKRYQMLAND